MKKFKNILEVVTAALLAMCLISSCSQQKENNQKPLTTEEIRANFIESVAEEVKKSSIRVDFRIEGTTLYMIDKSETLTGLNIIEKALKKHGVWIENPNNTLGHFGSSLAKLGFTHFVSWGTKDKKIHTYELKQRLH